MTFDGNAVNGAGADPPGREALVDELRGLALLALARLDPLLARLRDGKAAPCPLCAARSAHPEAAAGWAEHAAALVAALREALGVDPAAQAADEPAPPRPVQHVPVERAASGGARPVQRVPVDRAPRVAAGRATAAGAASC